MTEWYRDLPSGRPGLRSTPIGAISIKAWGIRFQRRSRMLQWYVSLGRNVRRAGAGFERAAHRLSGRGARHSTTKIAQLQLSESKRASADSESMHEHVALHPSVALGSSPSARTLLGYSARRGRLGWTLIVRCIPTMAWVGEEIRASWPPVPLGPWSIVFRHRDGHYLWLETIIVPVRDASGRPGSIPSQLAGHDRAAASGATPARIEERFRTLTEVFGLVLENRCRTSFFCRCVAEGTAGVQRTQPRNALERRVGNFTRKGPRRRLDTASGIR